MMLVIVEVRFLNLDGVLGPWGENTCIISKCHWQNKNVMNDATLAPPQFFLYMLDLGPEVDGLKWLCFHSIHFS